MFHTAPHAICLSTISLFAMAALGCQNSRTAVIPPPGGALPVGDPYYNRPAGAFGARPATALPVNPPINLAPGGLQNLPAPPTTSAAAVLTTPRDTYDVAARVATDSQPIRVLDSSAAPAGTLAGVPRGMPLNDGTAARSWPSGMPLPASVVSNPFGQLRGTADSRSATPQGFSGQDGQWRSRSSYEATERR